MAVAPRETLIVVREFTRPYKKILNVGGNPKWRVIHEGMSRHGLGRKNPRRGWKQHYAKFPQRGLGYALRVWNQILEKRRKAARAKAK